MPSSARLRAFLIPLALLSIAACDHSSGGTADDDNPAGGKADDADGGPKGSLESGFADCFDHGNGGAEPDGAYRSYRVEGRGTEAPYLVAVSSDELSDAPADAVLHHMIDDYRFTNYKCWDEAGELTGFDIESITRIADRAGYSHVDFVLRPFSTYEIDDREYMSLMIDLIVGLGDTMSAGLSITEDRLAVVDMVGPIYKAGKFLMARDDNAALSSDRLESLGRVPLDGYDALAGLSVVVQDADASIRGEFFRELEAARPDLVEYLEVDPETGEIETPQDPDTLQVFEVSTFDPINALVDSRMQERIAGRTFDLVMVDGGSLMSFLEEGKLGEDTSLVTANLAEDPELGGVFGTGDGISIAKSNPQMTETIEPIVAQMMVDGEIDALVERWFADDNAADPSWARDVLQGG